MVSGRLKPWVVGRGSWVVDRGSSIRRAAPQIPGVKYLGSDPLEKTILSVG